MVGAPVEKAQSRPEDLEHLNVSSVVGYTVIKVVHVIIGLNVGGAESVLRRVIESHSGVTDIQHMVISLTDIGPIGTILSDCGIQVLPLGMSTGLDVFKVFIKLRKAFVELQPDVVHTWMYHGDLLGGLAAFSVGVRNIVWCIRSTDITLGGSKFTLIIRKLCALISRKVPRVIVCAANESRNVHSELGYDSSKMMVIPNGFDLFRLKVTLAEVERFRRLVGLSSRDFIIGSVGRYSPVKDHETFVKAMGIVAKKCPNAKFVMIGRGVTNSNDELFRLVRDTGFCDRFFLLGERNDIAVCMKAMDIFCLHSKTEGFPNVLGEAMAMGCLAVATDVGDAAYLLNNRRFLVPPGDPVKLADLVVAVSRMDKAVRSQVGLENCTRICSSFSLLSMSDNYLRLYRSLCQ